MEIYKEAVISSYRFTLAPEYLVITPVGDRGTDLVHLNREELADILTWLLREAAPTSLPTTNSPIYVPRPYEAPIPKQDAQGKDFSDRKASGTFQYTATGLSDPTGPTPAGEVLKVVDMAKEMRQAGIPMLRKG